ncbi:hypothetical protein [Biostraticola tofi]|uniref:Uncharacterized protein n=1 Tax=Biostraticola tofi TaxID=466109 RepID=A0A4R3Z3K7_9GAMM|nr:hypothetical protein [Biostraticola tofi]TCW00402.1 hypothetical protein EDC52_101752 [Biostraticola tofi]
MLLTESFLHQKKNGNIAKFEIYSDVSQNTSRQSIEAKDVRVMEYLIKSKAAHEQYELINSDFSTEEYFKELSESEKYGYGDRPTKSIHDLIDFIKKQM